MAILVTGGAGYIGSHTLLTLSERGRDVLVLDDLSEGHEAALRGARLAKGSMLDSGFVRALFRDESIEAVFHFAARCYVGESVTNPELYYEANVEGTKNLLDAMIESHCRRFVLSSTCATYGEPATMPIVEDMPQEPVNPYGRTKLIDEWMLRDYHRAHGIDAVALRYFNAAGADPEGRLGEDHRPETHLIPIVLETLLGKRDEVTVFGDDYDTPDGTCVRDYVHVTDLAEAHVLALEAMEGVGAGEYGVRPFNLGNEAGTSVLQVIRTAEQVTGRDVPYRIGPRRAGDPPRLVGSSARIAEALGWKPAFGDIGTIVETAWNWHRAHPDGYGDG